MQKIEIQTSKTARYFIDGELTNKVEEVWIVCHGYAQLANYFLKKFNCLNSPKRVVIAPEALHRFYWNGFSGRVVASWMTKEDRQSDILDYVNYLDNVVQSVKQNIQKDVKIKVLGFSQGAATVCRWLSMGETKIDELILWGSVFPDDIDYFDQKDKFNKVNLKVVIGDQDEYYSEDKIDAEIKQMKEKSIIFDLIKYAGKHDLYDEILLKVS